MDLYEIFLFFVSIVLASSSLWICTLSHYNTKVNTVEIISHYDTVKPFQYLVMLLNPIFL